MTTRACTHEEGDSCAGPKRAKCTEPVVPRHLDGKTFALPSSAITSLDREHQVLVRRAWPHDVRLGRVRVRFSWTRLHHRLRVPARNSEMSGCSDLCLLKTPKGR